MTSPTPVPRPPAQLTSPTTVIAVKFEGYHRGAPYVARIEARALTLESTLERFDEAYQAARRQLIAMAPPKRPSTPTIEHEDGHLTIRVKRVCNGCNRELGDATEAELEQATEGLPLSDVRRECGCVR